MPNDDRAKKKNIENYKKLSIQYDTAKQNIDEQETLDAKIGRTEMDVILKKLREEDKKSYQNPAPDITPAQQKQPQTLLKKPTQPIR